MNEALAGDLDLSQAAAAADRATGHDQLARAREQLLRGDHPDGARGGRSRAASGRGALVGRDPLPAADRRPTPATTRTRGPLARADAVVNAPRGGRRERPRQRANRGGAARRGNRDLAARRYADARAAVGAPSPRRRTKTATCACSATHARSRPRPYPSRHATHAIRSSARAARAQTAGSTPARMPAWLRHADGTLEEILHLALPARVHRSVVARAPAVLPSARHARRAHLRRRPCPRASQTAPPMEAAARSGALQGTTRPPRRIRRARGARRSRRRRRRARRRDRRDRLPRRDLLLDPRPARSHRAVPTGPSSRPPSTSTRSPTPE